MLYKVYGNTVVTCTMEVVADSEDEAIDIANKQHGGITNYAGMGGMDYMIGVRDNSHGETISADDNPIFTYAILKDKWVR